MAKSLDYKLNNMIAVRSNDAAVRLRKTATYIDLLTIVDPQQLVLFFQEDIDRVAIRGLVDLKEITNALKKANNYQAFIEILNRNNANIFSNSKLLQIEKTFNKDVIDNALQELYEYDHKLKKTLTGLSRKANMTYVENGIWLLYASYGFLCGRTTPTKEIVKAPLLNIAIDFEIHGTKMYLVKKEKSFTPNEKLYVFLQREYDNSIPLNELSNSSDLKEIINDIERITKQSVMHSLEDNKPISFVKYKEKNSSDDADFNTGLFVVNNVSASIVELTGGKLKQDLSRILAWEQDPFEVRQHEKSTDYYENQTVDGTNTLMQIHRPINIYQKYAINSALNQNTVIIGAPGTGKSEVIANLVANIIFNKKSAIFVSEKKAALDVVVNRVGKLNPLILYMYDFKSKESFYKYILTIEEKLGQWYRDGVEDFLDENKINDKLNEFSGFYHCFFNLINAELEFASKRDSYNENYIDYINNRSIGVELNNKIRISSYLLLPDQSKNNTLWSSVSDCLARTPASEISIDIRNQMQVWYNSNHYLFDVSNFDDFEKNIWNEYVYFKQLCIQYEEIFANFPKILKALLFYTDKRGEIHRWSTCKTSKLMKKMYYISDKGILPNDKDSRWLRFKNISDKLHCKKHVSRFREFLSQFSYIKHLNWISFNKLEEFEITNADWKKIIQENWWSSLFTKNPLFENLKVKSFQQNITDFKRAEEFFTKDNDEFIFINYIKWLRKHLASRSKSEQNSLLDMFKQASKSIRPPVNRFVKTYYKELRLIFPIWVLNPDSVAQHIPLERGEFDYGIFDEASQMFLERGYPLVYRCKFNTIAGDMNQLKPTSFFASRTPDSDNESYATTDEIANDNEELSFDENESILSLLEKAENARWNKFHLRNHYRSVSKQLIEFSNRNIYNNNLRIVSINGSWNEKSLEVVDVEGFWHNRTNPVEAQKIVELIKKIHKNYRSILVVGFNLQQANLIEDLLLDDDNKDLALRERINDSIIITNLENVQGSEADLVLLSVSFAPSDDGILRANFGAINRDGGRNRLNVAITRARQKMIVVKSFKASDFSTRSLSGDATVFINWIRYLDELSEKESNDLMVFKKSSYKEFDNPFIETVYDAIQNLNLGEDYYLSTKLPVGDRVIDIGIMDSRTNRCVLGILTDRWSSNMNVKSKLEDCDYQIFLESRDYKTLLIKEYEWYLLKGDIINVIKSKISSYVRK